MRPAALAGRLLLGRSRLIASVAVAVTAFLIEPGTLSDRSTRMLVAWNVGAGLYIALNTAAIAGATSSTIRWRAGVTDQGRFAILVLVVLAALATMGAIFVQLHVAKDLRGLAKGLHLSLAGLTIVTAWVFIHLTFALHYAHEYFDETKALPGEALERRGGLSFPGTDEPDYWDFLYFSFIIGVASQTADVAITSKRMRRTSLAHSVVAFFFNSAILALTINIAAGLT